MQVVDCLDKRHNLVEVQGSSVKLEVADNDMQEHIYLDHHTAQVVVAAAIVLAVLENVHLVAGHFLDVASSSKLELGGMSLPFQQEALILSYRDDALWGVFLYCFVEEEGDLKVDKMMDDEVGS